MTSRRNKKWLHVSYSIGWARLLLSFIRFCVTLSSHHHFVTPIRSDQDCNRLTLQWKQFCYFHVNVIWRIYGDESTNDITMKSHDDSQVTNIWRLSCDVIMSVSLWCDQMKLSWCHCHLGTRYKATIKVTLQCSQKTFTWHALSDFIEKSVIDLSQSYSQGDFSVE